MLARATGVERVLCDTRRAWLIAVRHEGGVARHLEVVELRALFDVGLNVELSAADEQARDVVEEDVAHDEALAMPLLPPRVRKVEKGASDGRVWPEPRQREARVFAEHTSTLRMTVLREPGIPDRGPLSSDLETDEQRVGRGERPLDEEAGLRAGPDLELDVAEGSSRERA